MLAISDRVQIAKLEVVKIERLKEKFRSIPWRKIGWGLLVFGLMLLSFLGGFLLMNWYLRVSESEPSIEQKYVDWQVYKNKTYGFGLRYPNDWEVKEIKPRFIIFRPQPIEGSKRPSEYINLVLTSNKKRGKTLCEEDQSKCSFYTNGIFGERTTTPELESVFFAHGENDFTLTLHKYGSAAEVIEGYITIFEEMANSFRFTSEVTNGCEKDEDCVLGIRLDECCSCAEAFSKGEVEANATIAAFEADRDYSEEKVADCSSVDCSLCPTPPTEAVCISDRCQMKE